MSNKLSYVSGISSIPLLGSTIGQMLDDTASKYPDNEALVSVHQSIRWTYKELKTEVDKCALALYAGGLRKDDRIGIWAMNRAEWMLVQYASAKLGAVLVNINPSYRVHELEYALNQSGCKFLVYDEKSKYADYTAMLNELMSNLKFANKGEVNSIAAPELSTIISLGHEEERGICNWSDYMKKGEDLSLSILDDIAKELTFDQAINIQYTSGTTGFPKGATLSHHNILNNGYFVTESLHLKPEDRMIIPVPLYHCFGMVMGNLGCLTHGATAIYTSREFNPEEVNKTIDKEKATLLYGVPTMFHTIINHESIKHFNVKSVRSGIMAGAICPVELMKKAQEVFGMEDLQIAYGMTETSPVSTQTATDSPFEKKVSTVGIVQPHIEVKLIDPKTQLVVEVGEKGELCTRGYSVMLGYWNNEEKTKEAIDKARWMHTGDLATMDEDGYINIVGRIKDMIIRGGENIYPKEIETFLLSHPKVDNCSVIGVPDKVYGEAIMAWIQPYSEVGITSEELIEFCKGKIAHFKIPKYFKFVNDFPKTVTGKIRKVEMKEISIKELGL